MPHAIVSQQLCRSFSRPIAAEGPGSRLRSLVTRRTVEEVAVSDLTFTLEPGDTMALLGPNGAGKSTTLKMLTGVLHPSSGHLDVLGLNPTRDRKRLSARIGSVFGQRTQLWPDLPLRDSFDILRTIYRITPADFRARMNTFVDALELTSFLHRPVRLLSLGQRMRGEFAAALLHHPDILFLDEPTIGLDIDAQAQIRHFIRTVNEDNGTTIILTSHNVEDVETTCDRVLLINHGHSVYDGTLTNLKLSYAQHEHLTVRVNQSVGELPTLHVPATVTVNDDASLTVSYDPTVLTRAHVISDLCAQWDVLDLSIEDVSLAQVLSAIYAQGPESRPT